MSNKLNHGVIISKFDDKIQSLMDRLNGINKPEPPTEEDVRHMHISLFGHDRNFQSRKVTRDSSGNIIKVN